MGYKWLTLNKDFDRSLPITKLRYNTGITSQYTGNNDGFFSELPNINTNNQPVTNAAVGGAAWGYAFQNRFNLYQNYFTNRAGNFTDKRWNTTTLVSGTTYEYTLLTPLYYSGLHFYGDTRAEADLENKFQVYAKTSSLELSTTAETVSAKGGSFTVDVECDTTWTASTNDNWITLSDTTGGTTTISISTPYNQFGTRVGTVSFTDGEDNITLTVTQEANDLIPTNKMFRNGNRIN